MSVNRRTWTLLIVAVAVIGGVYGITLWQRSRETERLMTQLQSPDHAIAAQAMNSLRERVSAVNARLTELAGLEGAARWRAVELLAVAHDDASRDALIEALQAADPVVKAAATRALALRGAQGAADRIAMLATAEDEEMPVRVAAVRALQRLRTPTHLAELAQLATDRPPPPPVEDEEPEELVEEPLEDGGDQPTAMVAEEPVEAEEVEEWSDDTVALRVESVRAIATLRAQEGRADATGDSPALKAAAILAEASSSEEHNADVRLAASYALTDLAQLQLNDAVQLRAVEALLNAADDEVGDVRIAAIHGLTILRTPPELREKVAQAIENAINDDHYWVRVAAGEEPIGG